MSVLKFPEPPPAKPQPVPEDRISEALRQGRIGRLKAWWERRYCNHEDTKKEERIGTNGIDSWTFTAHWCARCGAWWARSRDGMEKFVVPEEK